MTDRLKTLVTGGATGIGRSGVRALARAGYALVACIAAAGLAGCVGTVRAVAGDSTAQRPNILMILADDLGYSDIGAFGGEIATPNLDALAASGRLVTNFQVGASCSPTRAMLMSGADHHLVGLGSMAEITTRSINANVAPFGANAAYNFANVPAGYEGYLSDKALSMPRILRDAGYHTYMAGKWHLATMVAPTPTFRTASLPNAKGFERSFALLNGSAPHFAPVPGAPTAGDLQVTWMEDDRKVALPQDFFSTKTITDKLIEYIGSTPSNGKPFFAYAAYTAPHWPLQAPDEDLARYAGVYDVGYDVIRARRIEKQKQLGIIPADFKASELTPVRPGRPTWSSLTAAQKASEARKMEVYAAMVDNLDRNIGRLVQYLKNTGRYENTLIVFASDNGADFGASVFPIDPNTDNSLANYGRKRSNIAYGERWAEVSATPFRMWKATQMEGGISSPMIVKLPHRSTGAPAVGDLAHVTDLLPTFLDVAGIPRPGTQYAGAVVQPATGISLLDRLRDPRGGRRDARGPLVGELFGYRSVKRDQWKLVSMPAPFGDGNWMLFDIHSDRGETTNLIADNPSVAARLRQDYDEYARNTGVVFYAPPIGRGPTP